MLKDMRERLGKLKGKNDKLFINEYAIKEIFGLMKVWIQKLKMM